MTAAELIALALLDSGVIGQGQTASAEDANNALIRLNMMLAQWRRKRWLVYRLVSTSVTATGAVSYTIGSGADFDVARPDRLEDAFVRLINPPAPNQVDYPLTVLQSREDYNRISLKQLASFPTYIWYDPAYPTGVIYPWPVPQADLYEVFVSTKVELAEITSLAAEIDLPPEYQAALHYNLCARLRPAYQQPPDPSIVALAKDALNVIRGANTQIQRALMPRALMTRGGGYNVWNDQGY